MENPTTPGNDRTQPDLHVPDVTRMLRPERNELITLLAGLTVDQWQTPTECPTWNVGDVARHLIGDDLSLLARQRDAAQNGLLRYATDHPGLSFRELLDGFNEQWVTASRFLGTRLILELLESTGAETARFYETVSPETLGEPVGMFGGRAASPYWQITGREYIERWAHHHQIRRALDVPDLGDDYLYAAADLLTSALAPAMAAIDGADGQTITFDIPTIGAWTYYRGADHWTVRPSLVPNHGLRLTLDHSIATTVLYRGLDSKSVRAAIQPSRDEPLADAMTDVISRIFARPS